MSKLLSNLLIRAKLHGGDGDDSEGEAVGSGNDDRVAFLNGISDNVDRERGEELADVNSDGSTSKFQAPAGEGDDAEAQAAAEQQAADDARAAAEAEAAAAASVETNAEAEAAVSAERIRQQADEYLAEAKRTRDELAVRAAQAPKEEVEDPLIQAARALQMGTEEEAVAALRKLTAQPAVDPLDMQRKIDERLSFKEAFSKFNEDYKDVMSDPRLRKMAEEADAAQIRAGDRRPYEVRFKVIGDDIRGWVNSKAAPANAANDMGNKERKKAGAPAAPPVASGKHVPVVEDEKEESVSDVIGAMAKQRGGPQWMNSTSR